MAGETLAARAAGVLRAEPLGIQTGLGGDVRFPLVNLGPVGHDEGVDTRTLDHQACYRAVASSDRRFDGVFYTAVRTTGIYCRPSCPAITPKSTNVEFYVTPAAAQHAGYRACKRCLPDASPGSPEWDLRGDTVARAMQLIDDGAVDRDGVDGLARRLGYSVRHLNRLLVDELGVGPIAVARARRAHIARSLIESSDLTLTDIAFAAGFGSVRQFNETIQAVYATTPSDLRSRHRPTHASGAITVRLAARGPFAVGELIEYFSARAVPGVEAVDGAVYTRSLDLPHGHGIVSAELNVDGVDATFTLADIRDLTPAVKRVRRLFDLDADPIAIDAALSTHAPLAPLVARTPGLRAPGSVDAWETIVRAIIGQQISVAGARTVTAKLVAALGERLAIPHHQLTHVFVSPERLASATEPRDAFAMPTARAVTITTVAQAVVDGVVNLDGPRQAVRAELLAHPGIGPWTADYVMLRGLGDPDVMLASDLGVRRALTALDLTEPDRAWAPWRTYAMHHLWNSLKANP